MNSFTAEAYRAAAEIIRRDYLGEEYLTVKWEAEAERMDKLAKYVFSLIQKVQEVTRDEYGYASADATAMVIMSQLLADGWTPPEGLF